MGASRPKPTTRHRLAPPATLVGVFVSILAVVTVSGGAGALTLVPPYAGSSWSANNLVATACHSTTKWVSLPHWGLKRAFGGSAQKISASSCSLVAGGNSGGVIQTDITVAIHVVMPSGTHTLSDNVSVKFTGAQAAHIGGLCPAPLLSTGGSGSRNCNVNSQYSFQENNAYLWDLTTAGQYGPQAWPPGPNFYNYTYAYNYTSCSSFTSCSYSNYSTVQGTFSGSSVASSWNNTWNMTFVHTDTYYIVLTFYIEAYAEVSGYPKSSASAQINCATLGNGVSINSIGIA